MMKKFIAPLAWVLGFQAVSALIGAVTRENMGWYDTLEKSALNPPDIAFPIVWTVLYVMLALAGWLMWQVRKQPEARLPFILYWVQIAMNWAWSFIFFAWHEVAAGFWWIVALDIMMIAFVIAAWNVQRKAAFLVVPTIVWGSFAAYLNYSIWMMN